MSGAERRLLSAPHRVRFAGFVATTPQLQQEGWELSAEHDYVGMGIRLAMRHQDYQLVAITNAVSMVHLMQERFIPSSGDPALTFHVVRIGSLGKMQVQYHTNPYSEFRAIDAKPQIQMVRIDKLEDLVVFAAPLVETQELIVDEGEVSAILAKLAEAQRPEQERIRARNRLRESREGMMLDAEPRRKFHAQILSIAA